jgi:hypothetical protein
MARLPYQCVPLSPNTELSSFLFISLCKKGAIVATSQFLPVFQNFLFTLVP